MSPSTEHPYLHLVTEGPQESESPRVADPANGQRNRRPSEVIHFQDTGSEDVGRLTTLKYVLIGTELGADQIAEEDIKLLRSEMARLLSSKPDTEGLKEVLAEDDHSVVQFARAYLRPKTKPHTTEESVPENQ